MSTPVLLVPGAPVVVPELAGSAAAESTQAVARAVEMVRTAARDASAVRVWGTDRPGRRLADGRATLRRWGVAVPVGDARVAELPDASVPDPALLGWWFLDRAGVDLPRSFVGLRGDAAVPPVPERGDLVVVVADGPASLTPRAPVPEDPRGVELDDRLATWVRSGGALPDPDAGTADEVGWWSRPAWRALAGLTGGRPAADAVSWAPFGVGYHAGRWSNDDERTGVADHPGHRVTTPGGTR